MKPTTPKNSQVVAVPSGGTSTLVLPTHQEDKLITIGDVQQIVPVCRKTLERMRRRNELPAIKLGGTILYSNNMVHEIIKQKFSQLRPKLD